MSTNTKHPFSKKGITGVAEQVHKVAERYHCHSARVQRLSYDTDSPLGVNGAVLDPEQSLIKMQCLQGLSFAQHRPFGEVVLKWELCQAKPTHNNPRNHKSQFVDWSSLRHEDNLLQQLAGRGCSTALLQTIEEEVVFLERNWHLTILVLPYYPLGSLKNYIKNNELTQPQKIAVLLAAAQAVLALHQAGLIHGDIKPSNFLVAADHLVMADPPELQLLLNDFALAESIAPVSPNAPQLALTAPKGTPAYLAPECWQGQGLSVQSDLYAFGVMMFEVLSGNRPYQMAHDADNLQDKVWHKWAVMHCQQPIPRLPIAWQAYQPWIDKMLAKQKVLRLSDIGEFIRLIE